MQTGLSIMPCFTDGLEDERRQGITIDVAYRYFRHDGCRYRIADTPGHLEYMRNMAVAAVASDIALILVDAIHGVREQTVQYSKIARFFGVRQFVLAVNKMDAVEYSQARFDAICADYCQALGITQDDDTCQVVCVPVSALQGDNIVHVSDHTPWYDGPTILQLLQQAERHTHSNQDLRLPIQHVLKDEQGVRWYVGTLHGDNLSVGETLVSPDSNQSMTVSGIYHGYDRVERAGRRQAIAISIAENIDLSRGAVLSRASQHATATDGFDADILWLDKKYENRENFQGMIKIHHQEVQAQLTVNDRNQPLKPGFVYLSQPVAVDRYVDNPHTGLFMLIDPYSERTVGVGSVKSVVEDSLVHGGAI